MMHIHYTETKGFLFDNRQAQSYVSKKCTIRNENQLFQFTQEILDYLQKDDKKGKGEWKNASVIVYIYRFCHNQLVFAHCYVRIYMH